MKRLVALALLAVAASSFAQAPAWPTKPVKFVNNFPPGGPSDTIARSIADVLQKQFNQPFVVENKAGASGNIGADSVAKSPPDGHTVLFGIDSTFTVNPHIYKGMPFKAADLRPVMVMASSGLLVGVHPATGFRTMKDPDTQRKFLAAQMTPVVSTQAQTQAMLKAYREQWAPVVQKSGYQP